MSESSVEVPSDEEEISLMDEKTRSPRSWRARLCEKLTRMMIFQKASNQNYADIETVTDDDL